MGHHQGSVIVVSGGGPVPAAVHDLLPLRRARRRCRQRRRHRAGARSRRRRRRRRLRLGDAGGAGGGRGRGRASSATRRPRTRPTSPSPSTWRPACSATRPVRSSSSAAPPAGSTTSSPGFWRWHRRSSGRTLSGPTSGRRRSTSCTARTASASTTVPGALVTLVPVGGVAEGVTTEGLRYPLRGEALEAGTTRGVSNVAEADRARVELDGRHPARRPPRRRVDRWRNLVRAVRTATALALPLVLPAAVVACGDDGDDERVVRLLTHDSFVVSPEVLDEFTERTGYEVEVVMAGDAGSMVNQAILTKDRPLGDALFGIDTTFLALGLDEGLFAPYALARAGGGPRRPRGRSGAPGHADRPRRRLRELRPVVLRGAGCPAGPGHARRPDRPRLRGPPRRRGPGDVVPGPGLRRRDGGRVR